MCIRDRPSPVALAALRRTTFVVGARVVEPDSVRRLSLGHDDAQGAVALPAELWRNLVGVPQVHGAFLQRGVLGHGDEGDDGEGPQGDAADEVDLAIPRRVDEAPTAGGAEGATDN